MFLKMNDGRWQLYIDYESTNTIIVKNHYPISWIDDFLDNLERTMLSLVLGYHQMLIMKNHCTKVNIKGLFKWLDMPFLLNKSLVMFMMMMDDILTPFTTSYFVIYLDNIIIFIKT